MWLAGSRYVAVLSVAGCLLTSLAVLTALSVYLASHTETLKQNAVNPHLRSPSDSKEQGECHFVSLSEN